MSLSVRAMAAALGVSKSQVHRDQLAGMPMHDVASARAWRDAHHDVSRTVDGRIDRPGSAPDVLPATLAAAAAADVPPAPDLVDQADAAAPPPATPADTEAYRAARSDREQIRRAREQIELDQLRGSLIALEDAKRLAFTSFRLLRDALLNIPARVKDQVAAETDPLLIEHLIEAEISGALSGFRPDRVLVDTAGDADDDEEASADAPR